MFVLDAVADQAKDNGRKAKGIYNLYEKTLDFMNQPQNLRAVLAPPLRFSAFCGGSKCAFGPHTKCGLLRIPYKDAGRRPVEKPLAFCVYTECVFRPDTICGASDERFSRGS